MEAEGLRLTDAALHRIARLRAFAPQPFPIATVARPDGHDLTFEAVRFSYRPGHRVLDDVTFTARAGTTTAVVGPSGAGKSTLIGFASRFHDPDDGTIRLGGVRMADLTRDQLFDAISVVPQDVYLFTGTVQPCCWN